MYQIDFVNHQEKIYFCGIGGSSMSGIAGMMKRLGFHVLGSDLSKSAHTMQVESEGIEVLIPQRKENITDDIDVVIFTAAISEDNPEYIATESKHIPHLTRAELLGQIMNQFTHSIGIAGSHGKTTTTSFLSEIFIEGDLNPSLQCGDIIKSIKSSYHLGSKELFVAEACEYTNSFLSMHPTIGIIMNIEADHLDFFKDLVDVRHSFRKYAEGIQKDGYLVINNEIENLDEIIHDLPLNIVTFGLDDHADYYAKDITYNNEAHPSFTVYKQGKPYLEITLQVPGKQYVYDALAAIAASDIVGASTYAIVKALRAYQGTARRFEYKGEKNGVKFVEDYAHHPTQVKLNVEAALRLPHNRVIALFQPHTYSRTKAFLHEFADGLAKADIVLITKIYAARETDTLGISEVDVANLIKDLGTPAYTFETFKDVEDWINTNTRQGDIVLSMNAGDAVHILEDILN